MVFLRKINHRWIVSRILRNPFSGILFLMLLVIVVYRPALNGPFVFDDGPNLTENKALHLHSLDPREISTAVQGVRAGPLGRPLAYASFALNYYFFGPQTFSFKVVNLIIHLANGTCVYLLTILLLRAFRIGHQVPIQRARLQWIGLATAGLWLLHPLALTPVLYVVQRMTSLATLFTLLAFVLYFTGRLKQFTGHPAIPELLIAFAACTPLAVFSKENAVLIPYFLILADWILLRFKFRNTSGKITLVGLVFVSAVPIVAVLFNWKSFYGILMAGYEIRPFTMYEHVLTECRVLWLYLKLILLPHPWDFGLYHDDIALSNGLLQPLSTFVAAAGLIILAGTAFSVRKSAPVLSFAILFFLLGHSIESSIFALEIAHEHRNYLPMYGLILMLAYYGLHPKSIQYGGKFLVAGLVLLNVLFACLTTNRALDWVDAGSLAFSLAERHPDSARSNYEAGRVLTDMIQNDPEGANSKRYRKLAGQYFERATQADQINPGGLFGILYLDSLEGPDIDNKIVGRLARRLSDFPIRPSTPTSFTKLFNCFGQGVCNIDHRVLMRLYETALANPRATDKSHALLANELAILHLEQDEKSKAIGLFKQSIAWLPRDPQLRFNLIHVLITCGQLNAARRELHLIRENFSSLQNSEKLASLEMLYAQAIESSGI